MAIGSGRASIIKMSSLQLVGMRALLATAAACNWELVAVDNSNAFSSRETHGRHWGSKGRRQAGELSMCREVSRNRPGQKVLTGSYQPQVTGCF